MSDGRPKPGCFSIVEMAPPHPPCARSALPEGAERPAGGPRSGAERRRRRAAQDAKFSARLASGGSPTPLGANLGAPQARYYSYGEWAS